MRFFSNVVSAIPTLHAGFPDTRNAQSQRSSWCDSDRVITQWRMQVGESSFIEGCRGKPRDFEGHLTDAKDSIERET